MAGREPMLRRQTGSLDVAGPGRADEITSTTVPKGRLRLWIKRLGTYFNILVLHIILIIRRVPHRISWGKAERENGRPPKNF